MKAGNPLSRDEVDRAMKTIRSGAALAMLGASK